MDRLIKHFDKYITICLLLLAMFFVLLLTLELFWETYKGMAARAQGEWLEHQPNHAGSIVVLFFNVLLMLEIIATIRVFDKEPIIKMRIILIVCLIATSRKILSLDIAHSEAIAELSAAALVLAIALSYYLINKSDIISKNKSQQ